MAAEPEPIHISTDSDLARLLHDAMGEPLRLENDGMIYRLAPEIPEDIWNGYDAQAVMATLDQLVGTWNDDEADAFIEALYRARDEGSRPTTES